MKYILYYKVQSLINSTTSPNSLNFACSDAHLKFKKYLIETIFIVKVAFVNYLCGK